MSYSFFEPLDGYALLSIAHGYTEARLYQKGNEIFAKHGSKYLRLWDMGQTSDPKIRWVEINLSKAHSFQGGRMILGPRTKHKAA